MRFFRTCFLCHGTKMFASRNMCIEVSKLNTASKHVCNLAKQLNVNNTELAKVFSNHKEKFKLNLYSESRWIMLFDYLKQYDFKTSEILEMIDSNPDILTVNRHNLHQCMVAWTNFRFDDKKLRQLLVLQPSCLLLNDKEILSRIPKCLAYVGKKHNRVLELISYSPNILFDNWQQIESKFNYILLNMELGPTQFVTTTVMSSTLFDIKCRHDFLKKLGMYKERDPKANSPNQMTGNPSLKKIVETTDKQFAIKVAGVTVEEYLIFKQLFKKQMDREKDEYSDDEEEDNIIDEV